MPHPSIQDFTKTCEIFTQDATFFLNLTAVSLEFRMAKVNDNLITKGLIGSVGQQLTFVSRAGETVVKRKSDGSTKPATAAQIAHRQAFAQAVIAARAAGLTGADAQGYVADFLAGTYPNATNEATYL